MVEDVADAVAHRVDEVEALAAGALLVADVVERGDDEVHRHEVDAPALEAHRREPRRQDLPHALDQLEEVVRAVDLVHLAGGRVADHGRRAVHRPRHLALLAHDLLALVLRHEVRMVEVLGLVEHVLAKDALVQAGGGDRRHVVEVLGVDRLRELDRGARAVDVDRDLAVGVGRQVVDGRQVVHVVDLALQRLRVLGRHAHAPGREVAVDRDRAALADTPVRQQVGHLGLRLAPQQEVDDRATAREQRLDQTLADESGGTGDEIDHGNLLPDASGETTGILEQRPRRPAPRLPGAGRRRDAIEAVP